MKHLFIFSLFLVCTACSRPKAIDESGFANVDTLAIDTSQISEWSRVEAERDAKNDSLMFIRIGLEVDTKEGNRYWARLATDHHIYIKLHAGCIIQPGMLRYNEYMYQKIQQKYGKNFLSNL